MEHLTYNEKTFLIPDSINTCAFFFAKIYPDGTYRFRIHDCNTGICLRGDLNDKTQVIEAVDKLTKLANGASDFAKFITDNYLNE